MENRITSALKGLTLCLVIMNPPQLCERSCCNPSKYVTRYHYCMRLMEYIVACLHCLQNPSWCAMRRENPTKQAAAVPELGPKRQNGAARRHPQTSTRRQTANGKRRWVGPNFNNYYRLISFWYVDACLQCL